MALPWKPSMASQWRAFLMICFWASAACEVLEPPELEFGDFKGWKITASSTCGFNRGPSGKEYPIVEEYCQIDGAHTDRYFDSKEESSIAAKSTGQLCSLCDPRDPKRNHSAINAVDQTEKWWQSPPLSRGKKYREVNLTIDLGQELQVYYLIIKTANSPRPALWVLERSRDYGVTYKPWQYFAASLQQCEDVFRIHATRKITQDDTVICDTEQTKLTEPQKKQVDFKRDEIIVLLLKNRPSAAKFYKSAVLQDWTKATNIRFRFLQPNTHKADLMSLANEDPTVTQRYFYSIRHITMSGHCICNGHASKCNSTAPEKEHTLVCQCQHNTCGVQCDMCCDGFVQKQWRPSVLNEPFVCEPCNCFGHSDECVFDSEVEKHRLSLDIHGNYEGGGVCKNCNHNTEGINCNKCKAGYYHPKDVPLNATDVCHRCKCDHRHTKNYCKEGSGECKCKPEYTSPRCDSCKNGYYGYPICQYCKCDPKRTESDVCDSRSGKCKCKPNFSGKWCDTCADGLYQFPYCKPCNCSGKGAESDVCNKTSGQCRCKSQYGGTKCTKCSAGHFNYPKCTRCTCSLEGTNPEICNKKTGVCACRDGYKGKMCDQCTEGRYKYPECLLCNCSIKGSNLIACDSFGNCSCRPSYIGNKCDRCKIGYYRYPECLDCECNSEGSTGAACDESGKCQCKSNFDGMQCSKCKKGYHGFPNCEACNCDLSGTIDPKGGCDPLPTGGLCSCKKNVQGRLCDQCKEHHWNLLASNPDGCEVCDCYMPGVVGNLRQCSQHTGKCTCKHLVESHKCNECHQGTYKMTADNLVGCSDCECNIGGSVSNKCDNANGQCQCKSHIEGSRCSEPVAGYYFPTLHQFQFEAEDARTPSGDTLKFDFKHTEFPDYSWKGYVSFSKSQSEIIIDMNIKKSSYYQMVFHCINLEERPISVTVTIVPDKTVVGTEETIQVSVKHNKTPTFVTVIGSSDDSPPPVKLATGKWSIRINTHADLLLDHLILIPSDYYKPTTLTQSVKNPCKMEEYSGEDFKFCQHFCYPKVSQFNMAVENIGSSNRSKLHLGDCFDDEKVFKDSVNSNISLSESSHHSVQLKMDLSKIGEYVLVIIYLTPGIYDKSFEVDLESSSSKGTDYGRATLYSCNYSSLCRQIIQNENGGIKIFHFTKNDINLSLTWKQNGAIDIRSVVAIPHKRWSISYIEPKPACVKLNGKCMLSSHHSFPNSNKVLFGSALRYKKNKMLPYGIADSKVKLIYLDVKDEMIQLKGNAQGRGKYSLVVHYYQPDYPGFDVMILINNGQIYEAKLHVAHCPSHIGCYSAVENTDGSKYFELNHKFTFTIKKLNHSTVWLEQLITIPEEEFKESILRDEEIDYSTLFTTHCGEEGLYITNKTSGFCRDSLFSITTQYNNGPLPCQCNPEGSESSHCEKFGGQCLCKSNVIGRKCEHCRIGYYGFPDCKLCDCPTGLLCNPINGSCICPPNTMGEKCEKCTEFSYGHVPSLGCKKCNCNVLGVKGNELQCDEVSGACRCKENIEGRTCDHCSLGFSSFPNCTKCNCSLAGTTSQICDEVKGHCICRKYVTGAECDVCKEGTFNIDKNNPNGCTPCFCFGRTKNCTSSSLYRSKVFNMKDWYLAELKIEKELFRGNEVMQKQLKMLPVEVENGIQANLTSYLTNKEIYFGAPLSYLGNKLISYGGVLKYIINVTARTPVASISAADVIFHGGGVYLFHHTTKKTLADENQNFSLNIVETNFKLINESPVTRAVLMQTLQNLKGLFIRAANIGYSSLQNVVLETANVDFTPAAEEALSVENCTCPSNYKGLSCEECAPGYYYSENGKYGGECIPCKCNGHAETCDPQTGVCLNCKHNTVGDKCEKCEKGYYGHGTHGTSYECKRCACPLQVSSNNFAEECEMSDDGVGIKCDCYPGYNGTRCEICATGYYGMPDKQGETCKPCDCFGNVNIEEYGSCDPVTGKCMKCLNNTHGDDCGQCAPGYYGDAIHAKNCKECNCDMCGTSSCHGKTGICECKEYVIGEMCDQCAPNYWNFSSCQGCVPCNCQLASESPHCNKETGQCKCQSGVTGLSCDQCEPGFWNYTEQGCTPCGCHEEHSISKICDAKTGHCECLWNLIGEKCDYCPKRWILEPKKGCRECNQCIHTLLDASDNLASNIPFILSDFKDVAVGYHTMQRITFISNTVMELYPSVTSLIPLTYDAQPLVDEVESLQKESVKLHKMAAALVGRLVKLKQDGNEIHAEVKTAERDINNTIAQVNETVMRTRSLTFTIIGTDAQYAIEAQNILTKIMDFDFSHLKKIALDGQVKADEYLDTVSKLVSSQKNLTSHQELMRKKLIQLNDKLHDLESQSEKSLWNANHTSHLILKMGIPQLKTKIGIAKNLSLQINDLLADARDYCETSSEIWEGNKAVLKDLRQIKNNLTRLTNLVKENSSSNEEGSKGLNELVATAKNHTEVLIKKAEELNGLFSNTHHMSEPAVKAANAYKNIIGAVNRSMKTAEHAKSAADEAFSMTVGLPEKSRASGEKSSRLLLSAKDEIDITQTNLMPNLKKLKDKLHKITSLNKYTMETEVAMNRSLEDILSKFSEALTKNASNTADEASKMSKDALTKISNIANHTPHQLTIAQGLLEITKEVKANVSLAKAEGKRLSREFPKLTAQVEKLSKEQLSVDVKQSYLKDQIRQLQEKVNHARNIIERINVGMHLSKNSKLVLKNPPGLSRLGTSGKISLYFRTKEENGLLLYMGNEIGTKLRSKRAPKVDFMALQIEDGFPTLTIDLGSGSKKLISKKYVGDYVWYQAITKRSGKSVKLTIREETKPSDEPEAVNHEEEAVVNGSSSILNLDQNLSRLIIGGYPQNFEIPSAVVNSDFEGDVEELFIEDTYVSLWNFNKAENVNGTIPRDKLVTWQPRSWKFNGDGYAILNWTTRDMRSQSTIQFKFKTYVKDGLLFLVEKNGSFMSIELVDGKVTYQFNLGDAVTTLWSNRKYDDDIWHSVEASRQGKAAKLRVDDEDIYENATGKEKYLYVSDYIYFGGYPGEHNLDSVSQSKFDGCIDDVHIQGTDADLINIVKASGITPGCPEEDANIVSYVKHHNGFVRWSKIEVDGYFQLNFRFNTTQNNALLFFATDTRQKNSMSLYLANGSLVLYGPQGIIRVSSADQISSDPKNYNDGQWHAVTATYEFKLLYLEIDDHEVFKSKKRVSSLKIVDGDIFFGGVPDGFHIDPIPTHNQVPFIGCIGDATFNGKLINFSYASEISNIILGKCVMSGKRFYTPPVAHIQPRLHFAPPDEDCALPTYPAPDPSSFALNGFRFGTKPQSHLVFVKPPESNRHKFSLEFKTEEDDGLIFYMADQNHGQHIALYFLQGELCYQYDCGSGTEDIKTVEKWNNGVWHTVVFTRNKNRAKITVDGIPSNGNSSKCNTTWMQHVKHYFMGGVPANIRRRDKKNLAQVPGFSGCLRKLSDAANQVITPNIIHGLIPCSDKVEKGIFFSAEGGYIIIDEEFAVGSNIVIEMDIKPRSLSGILVAVHGRADYLVLQLYKGDVLFTVDNGRGNISTVYTPSNQNLLCNGEWHRLKAIKNKNMVSLLVDTTQVGPVFRLSGGAFTHTSDPLYLGGHALKGVRRVGLKTRRQFVGCIRNVSINGMQINSRKSVGNVTLGVCPTI